MTLVLDTPLFSGEVAVAALSQVQIAPIQGDKRLSFACSKQPLAILFSHGDNYAAADLNGTVMNTEEIEKRFPGILAKFKDRSDTNRKA